MLPFPLIRSIATLCGETAILCTNKAIRGGFAWPDCLELAIREAKTLDKNTLFRMQCDLGAVGTCERMLDNEADAVSRAAMLLAKPPNYSGETALIGGCKQGNVSLVEILIRNSPNEQVLATNNHGISMDGDAELDALLSQHPAARAAYDRRIERLREGRMSDFDNRLRQLEADYKVLFEEQANQRQDIQALRDTTSTQFQRLDKEIQAMMDWGDVFPDLYDVLDIDEGAVDQEILRAFRIQVVRVHPDKLGPLASEDERTAAALRTRVILQAKNVLLNTESRKEYDSERRMRRQGEQQSKSGFSAPEEASAGMAHVWEVWANVVVEGFAKQFEAGARGERVVQLLETILQPAIGVGLGGERGFKLGLTLSTVFNTGCISVVVKALSAEDQKLFFQALEVLCTKMP
eukprot:gene18657-biopygen27575